MPIPWKTHGWYLLLIGLALFGFRSWLMERDARVRAEQQQVISDERVKNIQQQMDAVNAAAAQKVQVVTRVVHDAATPQQVVQAIPQLTDVPLNARTVPALVSSAPDQVAVDAKPFVELLGQCKTDSVNLGACSANLASCEEIVKEKDGEVAALKKGPGFWKQFKHDLKTTGGAILLWEAVKVAVRGRF